jgi:hypothetical protein
LELQTAVKLQVEQAFEVPTVRAANVTRDEIGFFLTEGADSENEVLQGRLLYPRFFWRGQGIAQGYPSLASPAYVSRDYSRLGFILITDQVTPFVFPSKTIPSNFPDTGDVIVFGCKYFDHIEAKLIIFPTQNLIFQNGSLYDPCNIYDQ